MSRNHDRLNVALILFAAIASGCGLLIDVDPPDPQPFDASISDLGALDLGAPDAPEPADSGPPPCIEDVECSDDDPCNGDEVCTSSGCAPGAAPDCSDDIDCTVDSCMPFSGCTSVPSDTLCNVIAGGVCDVGSGVCQYPTCTSATCVAPPCSDAHCDGTSCVVTAICGDAQECCGDACVPIGCADDNPCTDDRCHAGSSSCQSAPNTNSCDDGDACTIGDFCSAGSCASGTNRSCIDDGNPCSLESCDAAIGCVRARATDGASCSSGGDACMIGTCSSGACDFVAVRVCSESDGNPCTSDACDPTTGACVTSTVPPGTPCSLGGPPGTCDGSGACIVPCPSGTADCDGDGSCECSTGPGGGCVGMVCAVATVCTAICGELEDCCPCTGLCVLRTCVGVGCCPVSC